MQGLCGVGEYDFYQLINFLFLSFVQSFSVFLQKVSCSYMVFDCFFELQLCYASVSHCGWEVVILL